ncbi:hypothetical protein BJF90_13600 [Pseudonocardia sp. CNS-004]|nr:hypothetical protein BJF90_13600 [Pseudonocardia sp. CNS-004]
MDMPLGAARGGSGATRLELAHVTVTSSDGAVGTGFSYALGPGMEAAVALLEALHVPALRGLDPIDWDRVWYSMGEQTHRLGTGVPLLATSAVDIAIWDLRAVQAGLPLFRLLGAQREQVPVYGSGRATHAMSTEQLVEGALSYLAEGYRSVKLRAGVHPPATDLARVAAVRDAVGPEVGIMVDANERLDLPSAQWLAPRLADLGVSWFEEPLPSRHLEAYRTLAAAGGPPIAVGEHLLGVSSYVPFTTAAPVWMPDAPLAGGVSEFLRIAALAEAHGTTVTPHFLPELHVHLVAAARPATWLEHFPLLDDLLGEVLAPVDGMVAPPERRDTGWCGTPTPSRGSPCGPSRPRQPAPDRQSMSLAVLSTTMLSSRTNSARSRSLSAWTRCSLTACAAGTASRSVSTPWSVRRRRLRRPSPASRTHSSSRRAVSRRTISAVVERSMPASSPNIRWSIPGFCSRMLSTANCADVRSPGTVRDHVSRCACCSLRRRCPGATRSSKGSATVPGPGSDPMARSMDTTTV